jgi:gamma-glutamylcyclotransferase (GGCT)/AIG2-like uncharacterized protein YtfP
MTFNPHVFVYGTLLSTAGHPMGARLAREAELTGPATIQGRLYRIAWYPGLVETADAGERVHGEVYRLADPAASLVWLDAYEGLVPGGLEGSEYGRVAREVRLADGRSLTAWVYIYLCDTEAHTHLADGRWRPAGD